jgi:hypothetical protein
MEEDDVFQLLLLHIPVGYYHSINLTQVNVRVLLQCILNFEEYNYFVADYGGFIVGSFGLIKQKDSILNQDMPGIATDIIIEENFIQTFVQCEIMEFALLQCRLAGFDNLYFLEGKQYGQIVKITESQKERFTVVEGLRN